MKLMIMLLISLLLATDVQAAGSKKKCTKCERKFDVHADGQRYDAERMLGAQHAFAPSRRGLYLRGQQPMWKQGGPGFGQLALRRLL